jgi:hypothetical protein
MLHQEDLVALNLHGLLVPVVLQLPLFRPRLPLQQPQQRLHQPRPLEQVPTTPNLTPASYHTHTHILNLAPNPNPSPKPTPPALNPIPTLTPALAQTPPTHISPLIITIISVLLHLHVLTSRNLYRKMTTNPHA